MSTSLLLSVYLALTGLDLSADQDVDHVANYYGGSGVYRSFSAIRNPKGTAHFTLINTYFIKDDFVEGREYWKYRLRWLGNYDSRAKYFYTW